MTRDELTTELRKAGLRRSDLVRLTGKARSTVDRWGASIPVPRYVIIIIYLMRNAVSPHPEGALRLAREIAARDAD